MNRKILIILIITLVLLALLCGIYLIYDNYRFGQELYGAVNQMSTKSDALADGIGFLEEKFENGDIDDLAHNRHAFDSAILVVHSGFGYDDMPLLDDVRLEYIDRFEELWLQTVNDHNNTNLVELFTDTEKSTEITNLQKQLELMTITFMDFSNRYDEMSVWERCFVSWRNERKILSDQVRLP